MGSRSTGSKRGVEKSAPLESDLMLPLQGRPRGSSVLTIRIYTIVVDAGDQGATVTDIFKKLKYVPGFDGDTYQWWQDQKQKGFTSSSIPFDPARLKQKGSTQSSIPFDLELAGLARVRDRVHSMLKSGALNRGLEGGRGRKVTEQRYLAGDPPQGYRKKHILNPQRPWGYHDIDPIADREASRRHFARVQFLEDARKELARGGRNTATRRLLEKAVELFEGGAT